MMCPNCTAAAASSVWGGYSKSCLRCCARLILSTHPSREKASVMLASIERFEGSPPRRKIMRIVRWVLKLRAQDMPKPQSAKGVLL